MKAKRCGDSRRIPRVRLSGILLIVIIVFLAVLVFLSPLRLDRRQSELLVMVGLTLVVLSALPWES
ncbi:MAG: hypothetical protein L0228_09620 [Planctomycetes bacterium]|nr:hypothetical protein [Planctomycetota bacterium]